MNERKRGNNPEVEELEQEGVAEISPVAESIIKGEVDRQIATARAYPRSITIFKKIATDMATIDEETAESCFYVLPRAGKNIEGPSARLSEIIAGAWGHLRIDGRPIAEDTDFVTSRGTAWDVQTNTVFSIEVKRRILDQHGRRYSADMIMVTANAATSIAMRNALFKVIPSSYWRPIYEKCRDMVKGDLATVADRRAAALDHFQKLGVSRDRVFTLLQVQGEDDVTGDHLVILKGLATALKEGDATLDEAFPSTSPPPTAMPKRKSESAKAGTKPEKKEEPPAAKEVAAKKPKETKETKDKKADADAAEGNEERSKTEILADYIDNSSDEEFLEKARSINEMVKGVPAKDLMTLLPKFNDRKMALRK